MTPTVLMTLGFVLTACGGAHTPAADTADPARLTEEVDPLEAATAAFRSGDLEQARRLAERGLGARSTAALKSLAARVALAQGRYPDAVDLLADETSPVGVRLRARGHVGAGNMPQAVVDLASVEDEEPADGWAAAVLPLARAAAVRSLYRVEGDGESTLPLRTGAELPLVEVTLDGRRIWALIATGADLTVVDDDLREEAGIAETLALGEHRVHDVPVLARDLGAIGEELGVAVGLALGADVLLRFVATLDFRERQLRLRAPGAEPYDAGDAASTPFATLSGSFLAVPAELEGGTVGWVTIDSAGLFPIALTTGSVETLGRDLETMESIGEGEGALRLTTLSRIQFGAIAIEDVPAAVGLLPADIDSIVGEPILGTIGAGLLSQFEIVIDPVGRRLVFR